MDTLLVSTASEPAVRATSRRLFPFHLAPIDHFFLMDDRDRYPMTFASNIFFEGEIDQAALEDALSEARIRHPLLSACVGRAKQGKLCWLDARDVPTPIDWAGHATPLHLEREAIDLTKEVGLRVWVRQGIGQSQLVMQFHHACTDGTGAHRFIGDVLAAYARQMTRPGDELPKTVDYDPQLTKSRRHKLANLDTLRSAGRLISTSLRQLVVVFGKSTAPLAIPRSTVHDADADGFPGVVTHAFDRGEHQALREAASRHGVMLNDLLTAEMFQALAAWNSQHGTNGRKRLRIMMPSDLRDVEDFAMPAANMASYNFLARSVKDCRQEEALLHGIRDETLRIKHDNRGRQFVEAVMACEYVPGLLPYLLSTKRSLATLTLSNMGDPTRRFLATFPRRAGKLVCGNLVLQRMVGVSPIRPLTRASVSIVTMYRELLINVRCDPHTMTVSHARALLQMYVNRLRSHLESSGR